MKKTFMIIGILFATAFSLQVSATTYTYYAACLYNGAGNPLNNGNGIWVQDQFKVSWFNAMVGSGWNPYYTGAEKTGTSSPDTSEIQCPGTFPAEEEEECPNCPAGTEGSANYTLEIEMGGFRDGIYVCEVGFNAHKCLDKGRDPKGDHIVIGSGSEKVVITADTNNPTQFSFEDAQSGGTAKVYLNSANYGAAYYVKYCYDYTKVVVGDAEYLSGVELLGNLSGSVTLNVGDTGGYYNHAGVTGNISVQCSDAAAEVTPIALDDNLSQEVTFDHIFDLNGPVNTPLVDGCRFTIEFEETKRSFVRQLKDDNSTYSATVNTGVNYVMELLY